MGAKFYKYFHHGATLIRNFENSTMRKNRKAILETRRKTNHRNLDNTNGNINSENNSSLTTTSLDDSLPREDDHLFFKSIFRGSYMIKTYNNAWFDKLSVYEKGKIS